MHIHPENIELVRRQMTEVMRSVVDFPDEFNLMAKVGEQTVSYHTSCNKTDIGKLIGKEGKMASAFRTLLYSYSSRLSFRAILEIEI
jgi:predicted RNA-binding protein YlqC (UPF0109 family)